MIASTATIRKAGDQVHATFLREVSVFPPNGLDVRDNFFALQRPPERGLARPPVHRHLRPRPQAQGRPDPGLRRPAVRRPRSLYEKKGYGKDVDPWMTLIGYFNSMRELGGMRRLVDDDVQTRLRKMDQRGLADRLLHSIDELTSRKDSTDIPDVLDHLEVAFDPQTEAKRKEMAKRGHVQGHAQAAARRAAGDQHGLGRRGRAAARPDGRRRSAQDDRRVHPGDQPGRPQVPAWSSRSTTGRGPVTCRTTSGSSTTTPRSTTTSRPCR